MVERRLNADDWLRQISHAEDAVLPTNLGSLPSERGKQSTQIRRPKISPSPLDESPLVDPIPPRFFVRGSKAHKR